jgi:two-component system copper resistance phosphate regulon response regulator CusR|tara:strand:- start:793 stop:1512 length:720 start_codon:yes stop_codon:yes gene_type:complete
MDVFLAPRQLELPQNMRILVVEDEVKTAEYLQQGLAESGYHIDRADDGLDGFHLALQNDYDLVLLDVNLPTMDGWEVLELIRRRKQTRVIMLTANGRLDEKVRGLELGADDYMVKPFQFPELLARIRTLLRRGEPISLPSNLCVANLELDPSRHRAYRNGQRIDLTSKEFALLHLLMRRTGEVLTRTEITTLVWDINFDCDTNVVDVAIRRLRMKVDEPFGDRLIHTIRGVGYVLEARP